MNLRARRSSERRRYCLGSESDIARIFRVHRATISRIAAEARAMSAEARSVSCRFLAAKSTGLGDGPVSIELASLGAFGRNGAYRTEKLTLSRYQEVAAHAVAQPIDRSCFPDRHFWHVGYDKANPHAQPEVADPRVAKFKQTV